jgi:hypothetical protein
MKPPMTAALFGPNILLSTLSSTSLSLCSSLNVEDHATYPYKADKILVFVLELASRGDSLQLRRTAANAV